MSTLRELLTKADLNSLALPSNIRYGTAIFERNGVEIIAETNDRVEAWSGGLSGTVIEGGGSKRRVQLWSKSGELKWHCAGNPKDHDIFCKHCVSVLLYMNHALTSRE